MRRNVIDRMALLCTLHADGPKTLRLLREAGCTTIEKISKLPVDKVGKVLNLAPAAARRFTREARHLLERLEPDLEQEEVTYPPAAQPLAPKPAPPSVRLEDPEPTPEVPAILPIARTVSREHLDLRDRQLLDRVVDRWRDEETKTTPARVMPWAAERAEQDEHEELRVIEILGGEVQAFEPPPLEETREGLRPGELPGLDTLICERLAKAGIDSMEDLATIPIDDLVRQSRLTFTRARTLQYHAGRKLTERAELGRASSIAATRAVAPEALTERISPREAPSTFEDPGPPEDLDSGAESETREEPAEPQPAFGSGVSRLAPLDDGGVAGPFA